MDTLKKPAEKISKKVDKTAGAPDSAARQTNHKPANESLAKKPNKKPKDKEMVLKIVAFIVLVLVLILILMSIFGGGGKSGSVGNASLDNVKTYLSKGGGDAEKQSQDSFNVGDPIQVGFSYDSADDESLVKFVVVDKSDNSEVFVTNLFRLNPEESELFVSINNTNLPTGDYKVEVKDSEDKLVTEVSFKIK